MIIKNYRTSASRKERKSFNRSFARAQYAMHIICEIEEFRDSEMRAQAIAIRKFEKDIMNIRALLSSEAYAQLCADHEDFNAANIAYQELQELS